MSFWCIVFKAVVGEICVRGEWNEANGDSCHEEDKSLWECEYIFIYSGGGGFSFLVLYVFDAEYFFDWGDDISKNIVFGDDVGEGLCSIDDNEFVVVFVVPDYFVYSICNKFEVMIGLGGGEEEIDFSVLMLEYEFGSVFVGKHSEYRVVWFMFHDNAFIFDVVVLESIGVIEIDEEYFGDEILYYLSISFDWKHSFFGRFVLDLDEMDFILVVEDGGPAVPDLDLFYVVFALDLVYLLSTGY